MIMMALVFVLHSLEWNIKHEVKAYTIWTVIIKLTCRGWPWRLWRVTLQAILLRKCSSVYWWQGGWCEEGRGAITWCLSANRVLMWKNLIQLNWIKWTNYSISQFSKKSMNVYAFKPIIYWHFEKLARHPIFGTNKEKEKVKLRNITFNTHMKTAKMGDLIVKLSRF